jgi:hypothetical protein
MILIAYLDLGTFRDVTDRRAHFLVEHRLVPTWTLEAKIAIERFQIGRRGRLLAT